MGNRQHASALYNAGVTAANGGNGQPANLQQAFQNFVAAALADPTWWNAFYQCGNNVSDLGQQPAAIACWRRALECNMDFRDRAKVLCNMGWRLHGLGHTQESIDCTRQALLLDDTLAMAWVNLSCTEGILDRPKEAVSAAEKAFQLAPEESVTEMALAFACLFDRQFARGLRHMERRFDYKLKNFLHLPYPRWQGEPGGTVLLLSDQGLGDTLSFARFIPAVARKVQFLHICMQPELMRVFQHAFVGIPNLALSPLPPTYPAADYWTTFQSLPTALDLDDDAIVNTPQIDVPVFGLPKTWKVPDRRFHIGISWRGSVLNDINVHRSIPIEQFLDLYRVPGIQLYSLQVDDNRRQLQDSGCAPVITDLAGYIRDVADTVSLMRDLDLVITCESALGHICAAANKECWIPYSYLGRDYRIGLTGEDPIWTPKHRVFRQGPEQQWHPVFDRIVQALRERVG